MKTGAIINIVGGFGFIFMMVVLILTSSPNSDQGLTASIGVADTYSLIESLAYIFLLIIAVMSIVLIAKRDFSRTTTIVLASIQLVLAVAALVFLVIAWNFTVCCVGWILMWGNALQLIGSIICIAGALKQDA